jgi:hypothetical protein
MLFDSKWRVRTEPLRRGEQLFAFYDAMAGAAYRAYRRLLNKWIGELPKEDQADTLGRMRKGDNLQFRHAFAEVLIHAALRRGGFAVTVHPPLSGRNEKPDFLVARQDGRKTAYLEVISFSPTSEEQKQKNRDAVIYSAIDKVHLPPRCGLGLNFRAHGIRQPSLKRLRSEIEAWAAECVTGENKSQFVRTFSFGDWEVELTLLTQLRREGQPDHAILFSMDNGRTISPAEEIRDALNEKGNKYGLFGSPFVVVVADCKGELAGGERDLGSLFEALFGTIVTQVSKDSSGKTVLENVRLTDGYWGTPEKPTNQNVSAVILIPKPDMWALRNEKSFPVLIKNPWATHPLNDQLLPLPGARRTKLNRMERVEGTQLADLLNLPIPWPPDDEASKDGWRAIRHGILGTVIAWVISMFLPITLRLDFVFGILLFGSLLSSGFDILYQRSNLPHAARLAASAALGFLAAGLPALMVGLILDTSGSDMLAMALAGATGAVLVAWFRQTKLSE